MELWKRFCPICQGEQPKTDLFQLEPEKNGNFYLQKFVEEFYVLGNECALQICYTKNQNGFLRYILSGTANLGSKARYSLKLFQESITGCNKKIFIPSDRNSYSISLCDQSFGMSKLSLTELVIDSLILILLAKNFQQRLPIYLSKFPPY